MGIIPSGDAMNKVLGAFVTFAGICVVLLGAVFIIAWSPETAAVGVALVLIGAALMYYVYRVEKIEASKPTLVSQTFNVKMSGTGEISQKGINCRSCGAPVTEKDIKVVEGGLMATCPYCGVVFALQEAPKW
jgi:hypothetical protein